MTGSVQIRCHRDSYAFLDRFTVYIVRYVQWLPLSCSFISPNNCADPSMLNQFVETQPRTKFKTNQSKDTGNKMASVGFLAEDCAYSEVLKGGL